MDALRLTRPVEVTGKDYWGRWAFIRFSPSDQSGWFWKPKGENPIPISKNILVRKARRLALKCHRHELHVIEHIMALRWMGLDSVVIESSKWPPYHGRTWELWDKLQDYCESANRQLRWFTVAEETTACIIQSNIERITAVAPVKRAQLDVKIGVDYPGLGSCSKSYRLPDMLLLLEVLFRSKSQGWPRWLYYPSYLLQWFPHRPPHDTLVWPQISEGLTLSLFVQHRALDLLGTLALARHDGLVAGKVTSYRSGHSIDLKLLHKADFSVQVA